MDKKDIQTKLEMVVDIEAKDLATVLEDWFYKHPKERSLKFSDDPSKMPVVHLGGGEDSDGYLNYVVISIDQVADEDDYFIVTHRNAYAYSDEVDDGFTEDVKLWANRRVFIPGELSDLTEFVKNWIDPNRSLYETSAHQQAINEFINAYDKLRKEGINLFYDENKNMAYFYNGKDVDGFDVIEGQTEVDFSRLKSMRLETYDLDTVNDNIRPIFATNNKQK